jgi:tRNA-specific 2-thiouridylase
MRVAVGMSGGVDSSVAALLLKGADHDVVGVTMLVYPGDEPADAADAARVCERLRIPHHVVDLREEFRALVIDHTRQEYLAGRTPNPCVRCNRLVKFGLLVERLAARAGGVEAFATGHYARASFDAGTGRWAVSKAADAAKDQSYFLCLLGQDQIARALFPLGELAKDDVRRRAREAGLEVHDRPESQDFAAGGYRAVTGLLEREGPVKDSRGAVIGRHHGYWGYTVGQRRGLGVGGGEPLYVTRIDAATNTVVAGPESDLWRTELVAGQVHGMGLAGVRAPLKLSVKIRYRNPETPALVEPMGADRVRVVFDEPQRAVAPGQMAVCYDGERIALAGVIE